MDKAIWAYFQSGNFDDMLDRLSVISMNFRHGNLFLSYFSVTDYISCRRECDGTTPLMAACYHGHVPIVQLLLDLNCDVLCKDSNGLTAEDHAIQSGHSQVQ